MPEQLLMKRFKEERTQAIHITGSDLIVDTVLIPITRMPHTITPFHVQMLWWGEAPLPEVGGRALRCRFAYDGGEVDAVSAAKAYLALLDQLVSDFVTCYGDAESESTE